METTMIKTSREKLRYKRSDWKAAHNHSMMLVTCPSFNSNSRDDDPESKDQGRRSILEPQIFKV